MKRQWLWVSIALFFVTILISPKESQAASYYEGKVINIVVGYAPGGGYDRMARLLAKHLSRFIPGNPSIVVQNMPGASSMITANHIYNIAKPDGLTIGTFNRYLTLAQLLKLEGVRFDLMKYSWIGSAAAEAAVFTVRSDLPYKTTDDFKKAKDQIFVGNTGEIDTGSQFAPLLKEFLGPKVKFVTYPQTADIMLAIERKELDAYGFTYSTAKTFIDRGLIRPLIRGRISAPGIVNLPVNEDLATDPKEKTIIAMLSVPDRIGRPYVAPPKTPPDIMNILKDAFNKVARDPQVKEDAEKFKMDIEYTSSEEVLKLISYVLNQPEDIVKEISKYGKF